MARATTHITHDHTMHTPDGTCTVYIWQHVPTQIALQLPKYGISLTILHNVMSLL